MKYQVGLEVNKFRISDVVFNWYHKEAQKIKRGIKYRHMIGSFGTSDVDLYEIYCILERDKFTLTFWLVEHKVLSRQGKIEFIPLRQVELDKRATDNSDFYSVKLSKSVPLIINKDFEKKNKKKK